MRRTFTGQVEAAMRVDMAFETGGTLIELLVDDGEIVEQGAVIARLDTRALEAERRAQLALQDPIAAQLELAGRTAARADALGDNDFASGQRRDEAGFAVAELQARIAEIAAGLEAIDIAVDKSVLRAPFSGEAAARRAAPGQTVVEDQIATVAVEILHQDETLVFVRGGITPDAWLVLDGTHRFVDGQTVRVE